MDRKKFNYGWAALLGAFPQNKTNAQSQKVYYEMLRDIPDDWWDEGVKVVLRNLDWFPSVHQLGRACVPVKKGGGRLSAYSYEPEFEIPWQRSLFEYVSKHKNLYLDQKNIPIEESK